MTQTKFKKSIVSIYLILTIVLTMLAYFVNPMFWVTAIVGLIWTIVLASA